MTKEQLSKIEELFEETIPALDLHEVDCEIHDPDHASGECTCKMKELQGQVVSFITSQQVDEQEIKEKAVKDFVKEYSIYLPISVLDKYLSQRPDQEEGR